MAGSSIFTFTIILLSLSSLPASTRAREIVRSPEGEAVDLLKTGEIYTVDLPWPPLPAATALAPGGRRGGGKSKGWKLVLGVAVGLAGVAVLVVVVPWICRKAEEKERAMVLDRSHGDQNLRFAVIGNIRIPVAGTIRTLPNLENDEFVPSRNPSFQSRQLNVQGRKNGQLLETTAEE